MQRRSPPSLFRTRRTSFKHLLAEGEDCEVLTYLREFIEKVFNRSDCYAQSYTCWITVTSKQRKFSFCCIQCSNCFTCPQFALSNDGLDRVRYFRATNKYRFGFSSRETVWKPAWRNICFIASASGRWSPLTASCRS